MKHGDAAWMEQALRLAREAGEQGEVPVGAVVVRDGQVVGQAGNVREGDRDPTGHAELSALRAAAARLQRWNLSDCDLYVTLEPCAMCAGAILLARIRRLVYGAPDPKAGACGSALDVLGSTRNNHRVQVLAGVLAEPSAELLRGFFAQRRRTRGEVAEHG